MRVLVAVASFPPAWTSAATLYSALVDELAGYPDTTVTVVTLSGHTKVQVADYWRNDSVKVKRIAMPILFSAIPCGGGVRQFWLFIRLLISILFGPKVDVCLAYSPPLFLSFAATLACRIRRIPCIVNVQDLHPKVLVETGLLKSKQLAQLLFKVESIVYRLATTLVVYSGGNSEYLIKRGVLQAKIEVCPNWYVGTQVSIEDPVTRRIKAVLANRLISIVYAGSFGVAQQLGDVIECAKHFEGRHDVQFVLIGDGPESESLQRKAKHLKNVVIEKPVAPQYYATILEYTDIGLVCLGEGVPRETVPGKLQNLMAAGVPVVAAVPEFGDASSLIRQSECGLVVASGDIEELAKSVLRLVENSDQRQQMGRRGIDASREFSVVTCAKKYRQVILDAVS